MKCSYSFLLEEFLYQEDLLFYFLHIPLKFDDE